MATVTESDIKELKELITNLGENLNSRMKSLEDGQKSLEIGQAEIKGRLAWLEENSKKIPDLAEKVGELKNWKQVGLILLTAVVSSIFSGTTGGAIGWFLRGGNRI